MSSPRRSGSNFGSSSRSGEGLQHVEQLEDARLAARADVERARLAGFAGQQERTRDVADVDVVARLQPVAVHRRRLPSLKVIAEDRDDTRLAVRRLAWAVDVSEPEDDVRDPVEPAPRSDVRLAGELRGPVRREWLGHRRLGCRNRRLGAVEGAAGRGEDGRRTDLRGGLQDVERSADVDVQVALRVS